MKIFIPLQLFVGSVMLQLLNVCPCNSHDVSEIETPLSQQQQQQSAAAKVEAEEEDYFSPSCNKVHNSSNHDGYSGGGGGVGVKILMPPASHATGGVD